MGEELPENLTFHPQNNKQAYLAYAVGLLTDPEALPEPRTNEEVLLRMVAEEGVGGSFEITNGDYLFFDGARVDVFEELMKRCKKLTSCYSMFETCGVREVDVSGIDTSEAVSMARMFYNMGRGSAIGIIGLSKFDTSKVIDMANMFGAMFVTPSAENNPDVSSFDTSNVTNMSGMFSAYGLSGIFDLSHFNTANATNMSEMFYNNSALEEVIMRGWDTAKVTNMQGMFQGTGVKRIDFSTLDTSSLTSVSYFAHENRKLEEIIGFSIMSRAGISFGPVPYASATARYGLKRLTFRTDLPEGSYAIRGAINIKYCSFERDGMVEMFNTLPDVSGLGLNASYTKITITGNPCLTGLLKDGVTACDVLTDEDRAIATNKGWSLVE